MLTFNQMVNGPKSTANTFEEMTKAKDSGWQPIPGGKRGGQRKKVGGKWSYRYPDQKPTKKEGAFSKLFGGMKKLFGKKPTPASREKLEKLSNDKGMLSGIAKLTDLTSLFGLRDMLLAHGAEAKKPRAAAEPKEPKEPKEPSERENNFDTMPDYEPRERKTNPLNKLLALVNKRIGQLESEEPEKKDEPKAEGKKVVRVYKLGESKTVGLQEEISAALEQMGLSTEMLDERQGEGRSRTVDLSVKVTGDADKIDSVMSFISYRRGTTLESEDGIAVVPESEKGDPFEWPLPFQVMNGPMITLSTNERIALSLVLYLKAAGRRDEARNLGMDAELYDKTIEELKTKGVLGKDGGLRRTKGMTAKRAYDHVKDQGGHVNPRRMGVLGIRAYIEPKSEDNFDTMPESDAQGTQSTKDADAAHPEDRHEEVPDRKTRGLGEHNDKLSNIVLDGKPLSDDTEFLNYLEVDDYPYGRDTTTAKFTVERERRPRLAGPTSRERFKDFRYRAVMQTVNPKTGVLNKPKKATYSGSVKFFMHEGKTYVLEHSAEYGMVRIQKVAGGFKNAMFETPDAPRPTNSIAVNTGGGESNEHPAGYSSLYEAATGKPAPKVQDFKDARKRMEDRREAHWLTSRQKIAEEAEKQAAEKPKSPAAQEKEESGTGASYGSLASYAQEHKKLIDEDIVRFDRNAKFVNGVAKGDFRLSNRDGTKPKGSGIVAGQYGLDTKGTIHHIPSGASLGGFSGYPPAKRVAILLALDKNHKKFGSDLRGNGETFTDQQNAEIARMSETIKATIHDVKTPDDAHREIRDLMPASLLTKEEKAAKAASLKSAATAKTQTKLDSLGHFKEDKKLSFFARPGAVLRASAGQGGSTVMRSEAHKLAAEFTTKDEYRTNLTSVLHRNEEAIASDGHRLIIVPTDNRQEGRGFILPGKAKDRLHKKDVEKNADRYGPSLVAEKKKRHTTKSDPAGVADFSAVISSVRSGTTNKATASVPHLQAAADHALAAAKRDGLKPADAVIVLEMEGNHLLATSQAEGHGVMRIGKTNGAVGTKAKPKVRIGLNAQYIKDALRHSGKNAGKNSVSIRVQDKNSAMIIEHDNSVQHIIMPVKLAEKIQEGSREGTSKIGRTSTAEEKLEAFNSDVELGPYA